MDNDRLDGVARGEGSELGAFDQLGHILQHKVDAQVGLVGAVGLHGLEVGDAPEGGGGGDIVGAELGKDRGQHVLEHSEHVVLGGEGHLHVELVELAGGAVAAGVLVPKAGGDLEVAVKAGGHQKLLELLRGLGQGVELAGVLSRGHQIVTRALGAGGREDGGGDLQEAVLGHGLAQGRHDVAAEDDVLLDGGISEV